MRTTLGVVGVVGMVDSYKSIILSHTNISSIGEMFGVMGMFIWRTIGHDPVVGGVQVS